MKQLLANLKLLWLCYPIAKSHVLAHSESKYIGADTAWVQTSYSARIRGRYAGIGMIYDPVEDVFMAPDAVDLTYLLE